MSLADFETSEERAIQLANQVKRLFRNRGGTTVPVVVVEGESDRIIFQHLGVPADQIFVADGRTNVEVLLVGHLKDGPPHGAECLFLTDCDGKGKSPSHLLRNEDRLVITQCCDIEADLFEVGVVERALTTLMPAEEALSYIDCAKRMSLPLSLLRRRAARAAVSMSVARGGERVTLLDFSPHVQYGWRMAPPDRETVLQIVSEFLGWSQRDIEGVNSQELDEPLSFDRHVLGKDAVDALFMALVEDAVHKVEVAVSKKKARKRFDYWLFQYVRVCDLDEWTIGRRLAAWQAHHKVQLIEV